MKHYSAWEWLLIDCANQYGLDKQLFETRIKWTLDNLHQLQSICDHQWKEKPLYLKAVGAIRKAQKGIPTGHMVAVDSSASGAQLMSAMTNCIAGAMATGLIDPNKRADLYTETTVEMNSMLHESGISVDVPRADMKQAVMTVLYGSKAEPKKLFGEDTTELTTFYKVLSKVVPGAMFLLQDLLEAWNSYSKAHQWQMPDGFEAVIKVMETKECRIEIDELAHTQLSYQYKVNEGSKKGLSIGAK